MVFECIERFLVDSAVVLWDHLGLVFTASRPDIVTLAYDHLLGVVPNWVQAYSFRLGSQYSWSW